MQPIDDCFSRFRPVVFSGHLEREAIHCVMQFLNGIVNRTGWRSG
jgi:hypothetical protein